MKVFIAASLFFAMLMICTLANFADPKNEVASVAQYDLNLRLLPVIHRLDASGTIKLPAAQASRDSIDLKLSWSLDNFQVEVLEPIASAGSAKAKKKKLQAGTFRAEGDFDEFYLDRNITLEIFHILPNGGKENLCLKDSISATDFQNVLEIHISWAGIRVIYPLTNKHFINSFVKGIFQCDFDMTSEAFRPLFDSKPELIGRGINFQSANPVNGKNEEFDRPAFFKIFALYITMI